MHREKEFHFQSLADREEKVIGVDGSFREMLYCHCSADVVEWQTPGT